MISSSYLALPLMRHKNRINNYYTHLPKMSAASPISQGEPKRRVAVIGAGISGLAAAYNLKLHGLNVTVFETDKSAGGKLRSISQDGLIWDEGANTMTESESEVTYLLDNLGLREKQQFPLSQNKRYIARNGTPILLPSDPITLFKSNFLSAQSKFQIMLEPFLWKKSDSSKEESVGEFFGRHFGKEVVDYLVDPFIAGTSAGDTDSLSMRHVFPEIWELDKKFGSIISGAIQSKFSAKKDENNAPKSSSTNKKTPRGSFSFVGGMQTLPDTLCEQFGKEEIKLETKVLQLCYGGNDSSPSGSWSISSSPIKNNISEEQPFDAVIMTAPLSNVKEMKIMKKESPFLLDFLPEVNYLPLSVIITTFRKEKVKRPLEGFGVLVPSKEQKNGLKTLGTLFSSMMFPDRAPNDLHLYTTFVGGSRNRELAKASTEELKEIVTSDLRQLLGVEGDPTFVNHYYWSKGFPQYGLSYDKVLQAIDTMEVNLPGFFYAGNHRGGLSVGKALSSGCKAADLVISYLESVSDNKVLNDRHN